MLWTAGQHLRVLKVHESFDGLRQRRSGYEIEAISAVIEGGRARRVARVLYRTVLGTHIIAFLNNLLNLLAFRPSSGNIQRVIVIDRCCCRRKKAIPDSIS